VQRTVCDFVKRNNSSAAVSEMLLQQSTLDNFRLDGVVGRVVDLDSCRLHLASSLSLSSLSLSSSSLSSLSLSSLSLSSSSLSSLSS